MSFSKALFKDGKILLEFSSAQIVIEPNEKFNSDSFLEMIASMRVKSLSESEELFKMEIFIDVLVPMDDKV